MFIFILCCFIGSEICYCDDVLFFVYVVIVVEGFGWVSLDNVVL